MGQKALERLIDKRIDRKISSIRIALQAQKREKLKQDSIDFVKKTLAKKKKA